MQRQGVRGQVLKVPGAEISAPDPEFESFSVDNSSVMEFRTHQGVEKARVAPGVQLIQRLSGASIGFGGYRILVLVVTFLAYTSYHASRRPTSIVKSVLHHPEKALTTCEGNSPSSEKPSDGNLGQEDWKPFDGKMGQVRLGNLDLSFLTAYAVGVMVSGYIGDHCDLRQFLLIGMLGSGFTTSLFALGFFFKIHSFAFYVIVQVLTGLLQSTGWPVVVAIVAHWFGKGKRGLVLGIWNAHTSVGNSLGALLAGSVLKYGWGWSFLLLGILMCVMAGLVWSFLIVYPSDVSLSNPGEDPTRRDSPRNENEDARLLPSTMHGSHVRLAIHCKAGYKCESLKRIINVLMCALQATPSPPQASGIGFFQAFKIPGVIPFAMALFFSKLVAYTFLYWLPFYASSLCFKDSHVSSQEAGNLSAVFDIGGIVGGVFAGFLSDWTQKSATVSAFFIFTAVPFLLMYNAIGHLSLGLNIMLLLISGLLVNGPYALITTAVSADLGSHRSIEGNQKALATVTAIIDGMGSFGAALGPTIAGRIIALSEDGSFTGVFSMLAVSCLISGLLLSQLVWKEYTAKRDQKPEAVANSTVEN